MRTYWFALFALFLSLSTSAQELAEVPGLELTYDAPITVPPPTSITGAEIAMIQDAENDEPLSKVEDGWPSFFSVPGVGERKPELPPARRPKQKYYGPASRAPIWPAFIKAFKECEPECEPGRFGTFRSGGRSCHNGGKAVDLHAIVCDGKEYPAIKKGRFQKFVGCMRTKMKRVLYFNGRAITQGHRDHGHFSNGCFGGSYY